MIYHRGRDIGDFGLAVRITEQFVAAVTAPIGDVALGSAGGFLGVMGGELMTKGRDYSIIQGDFHSTGRVAVKLAATVAAPIGNVACFGAGCRLCVMGCQLMAQGQNLLSSGLVAAGALLMLAALLCAGGLLIDYFSKAVCNLLAGGAAAVLTYMPMIAFIVGPFGAEFVIYNRGRDIGNLGLPCRVTEQFPATVAAPVGDVALGSAGGSLGLVSCQLMAQSTNYGVSHSNLIFTSGIAEKLRADITAPIGDVAVLGAGLILGIMRSKRVGLHGDNNRCFVNFIVAGSIAEILPADRTLPASDITGLGAGSRLLRHFVQRMTLCRHHGVAQSDLVLSFRITEKLGADITAPIGCITVLGASGCLCLMGSQGVPGSRNVNRRQRISANTLLVLAALLCAGGGFVHHFLQIVRRFFAGGSAAILTFVPVLSFVVGPGGCVFMGNNRSNYALNLGIAFSIAEILAAA